MNNTSIFLVSVPLIQLIWMLNQRRVISALEIEKTIQTQRLIELKTELGREREKNDMLRRAYSFNNWDSDDSQ